MMLVQHAKRNYVMLSRMGLVKCKDSTSAKLSVHEFDKAKEQIVNTKASWHFTLPESTARLLKMQEWQIVIGIISIK